MTPTTRNSAIAIAAAATIIPAVAAAMYPDRTRRLGHDLSNRVHDAFDSGSSDVEGQARKIMSRLDGMSHDLQVRAGMASDRPSYGTMIAAGVVAAIAIPAALTAWFAPDRVRQARDYVFGEGDPEQDLADLSSRLDDLTANIERQREDAFDSVTAAAHRDD
ncbi:hypothetical protein PARPLA_02101 [Rhodobacteraceae bacterium THAF1]|uniref:hypothetical protein n=1 Tax=Palleronia sp. THAF1 TaxID=2587842 RepID=UPI000F3DFC01|nr:hypothetical protein [Palleronia sp. THAF1]QFU07814.1 hypothetical protein FIU81_03910 [Palleronia sp. THAF1]VDC25629.1 hypothetical protein PARPLA_02101 [Rhodobacteraceae bacterium THAF1]